ncbi:Wound-induced protein WIN2 [Linum grandiflorum]
MRVVALVSVMLFVVVANGEDHDHKCTCKHYRDMCNQCDVGAGRCCSRNGYCGSTSAYCPAPAAARTAQLAAASRNIIPRASVVDNNMSVAWRRSYGWVSICGSTVHHVQGRHCLMVTNGQNGKEAVVRIVEKECGTSNITSNSLEMDYDVFQCLHDQCGNGYNVRGHLLVSYRYVNCLEF